MPLQGAVRGAMPRAGMMPRTADRRNARFFGEAGAFGERAAGAAAPAGLDRRLFERPRADPFRRNPFVPLVAVALVVDAGPLAFGLKDGGGVPLAVPLDL